MHASQSMISSTATAENLQLPLLLVGFYGSDFV